MSDNQEQAGGAAYVIDRFTPLDRAGVPIADLGFNRGGAVYDVVSVSRGSFFRLDDHQRGFAASCRRVRLTNPLAAEEERAVLNRRWRWPDTGTRMSGGA